MAIYFGQDIDTKLAQADAYYAAASHISSVDWLEHNEEDARKAGLVQAEREIDMYLGTCLEDNYVETDFPTDYNKNFRPDYAVFEQALFILDNTARTRSNGSGMKMIESALYQEEERTTGVPISPQATRFLRLNRLQAVRG